MSGEADAAFQPISPTYALAAAASPATAILLPAQTAGLITAKVYNSGTVFALVSWGPTAAAANAQCVAPIVGTPQYVLVVAPGEDGTFTVPGNQYWTAGASTVGTVYIQFGSGI